MTECHIKEFLEDIENYLYSENNGNIFYNSHIKNLFSNNTYCKVFINFIHIKKEIINKFNTSAHNYELWMYLKELCDNFIKNYNLCDLKIYSNHAYKGFEYIAKYMLIYNNSNKEFDIIESDISC